MNFRLIITIGGKNSRILAESTGNLSLEVGGRLFFSNLAALLTSDDIQSRLGDFVANTIKQYRSRTAAEAQAPDFWEITVHGPALTRAGYMFDATDITADAEKAKAFLTEGIFFVCAKL